MKSMGIVGLPDDGSVQKYWLAEDPRVDPMDTNCQTLMSASITRVDDNHGVREVFAGGRRIRDIPEWGEHLHNPTLSWRGQFHHTPARAPSLPYHNSPKLG